MDDCSYRAKFNSQVLKGVKTNDCLGICLKNNDMSQKWLVIMYSLCDLNPNLNVCFSNVFFGPFSFLAFISPPPPPTSLAPPISLAPPPEKDSRPRYERQKWYRHIKIWHICTQSLALLSAIYCLCRYDWFQTDVSVHLVIYAKRKVMVTHQSYTHPSGIK